jgi:uncharacterized membrane protein
MKGLFALLSIFIICAPAVAGAQGLVPDEISYQRARVIAVPSQYAEQLPVGGEVIIQTVQAEITSGEYRGERIEFQNDFVTLKPGNRFILRRVTEPGGFTYHAVADRERRPLLVGLVLVFMAAVLAMGGRQGVRSLLSLLISFLVIFLGIIPLLLRGHPPLLVGGGGALVVLAGAILITHGFKKRSFIAFLGTAGAVVLATLLALAVTSLAHMSGLASNESVYLSLNTGGKLDFVGLYLASVIIGMLGVLDDVAITQVAVVHELRHAAGHLSRREIFTRAMRVGKEHVAALVNTLVLAYAGVALPTILYVATAGISFGYLVNQEMFASEIIRTVIGSLGLIAAVPLSTWLAVVIPDSSKNEHDHHGHAHVHAHGHHHH